MDHILLATRSGDAGVAEVFRTLQLRIRDSTWTIVFKALIMVHLMIRNGQPDVTLAYLAQAPKSRLATSEFTAGTVYAVETPLMVLTAYQYKSKATTYNDMPNTSWPER